MEPYDTEELCKQAGRDHNEEITRFTLGDYAAALIGAGYTKREVIQALQEADVYGLSSVLCDASGWSEVFENYYATGRRCPQGRKGRIGC